MDDFHVVAGIKIIGSSAVIIALIKLIKWGFEFVFGRLDMRTDRVEAREKALETRINKRMDALDAELGIYREATMVLVEALSMKDPANPALLRVSILLRSSILLPVSSDGRMEELLNKLRMEE